MIPIKDLLNKIKWDKNEKPESYKIYYYDRVLDMLVEINYTDIIRMEDTFIVIKRNNEETLIPMHRIKAVKKNNDVIWERIRKAI